VLTETDIAIGKLLISRISKEFPGHNIIDEEMGVIDNKSSFTWVIDPIDGTSNFAAGIPMYGIMIGLLKEAEPIAGGISLPAFNEIYIAEKGFGAFKNERSLRVTEEANLLSVLVGYQIDGHQENPDFTREEVKIMGEIILQIRNLRASGAIAYDAPLVCEGKIGGFLNRTSKIWDNVAAHVLVEEAGGICTDFFGNPMEYSSPLAKAKNNFTVCIAAPALHKKLQDIIHSHK
jgi:myo-inositol-1(or 4)-monophosphatase